MGKKKERQQKILKAQELYNAGRSSEAAEMLWSCLNLYALKEKESREYAVLHCSLGAALAESGQLKSARLHFMEALNIFNALGEIRDAAMVEFNLGNVYKYAGSWQAAYNHYNAALSLYERLDDHSGIALVLLALGHFFSEVGFGAQVESYLDRLSQFKEYIEKDLTSLWSYVMLCSNLESMKGNISKSLELAKAALEHAKRLGNASYVAETEGSISENLRRLGRTELASDFAQRAYEFAKTTSDRQVIENTYQLALAVTEAGDKDKTIALYEECLTLIDQQRSQLDGAERYLLMGRLSEVGQKYVDFLANIHDAKRAFKVTERVQARTLLDLMFRHQIKRQGGRVIRAGKNGRITLDVPSLTDIVSSIREDDIHVLKFFFTSDKLLGWLLKPDGALEMWDASGAEQHYNKLLSQLPSSSFLSAAQTVSHSEIENGITQLQVNAPLSKERSQWSDVSTTLRDLYVELFPGEVRQYLETHQGKLVVIPHWSMFEIPFFPLGPDNDKPLGTRWQISMVPSMGVFLQLDRRRDSREDTRNFSRGLNALIVGDCGAQTVAIPAYPLAEEDKYFLVAFCDLPGSRIEIKRIARILQQSPLAKSEANIHNVLSKFKEADIMHFATHGVWYPLIGARSFILLAPSSSNSSGNLEAGVLMAQGIRDYITQAELVVLSACQTGRGSAHPDTYIGLAESFLIAGARSVIISLWPISDVATVFFMETFYTCLSNGATIAESLQQTQQAFRQKPGWSDGFFWAGFQLIGRPFDPLQGKTIENKYNGPAFCGGDVLWLEASPGDILPLKDFHRYEQVPDDFVILTKAKGERVMIVGRKTESLFPDFFKPGS